MKALWVEGGTKEESYLFQLLQNMIIDAALLEINSGTLDDICDDLLINISDLCIRHFAGVEVG